MLRSDRSRKQPDSIYRLQEEDYRLRNRRSVVTGGTIDADNHGEDSHKSSTSHDMRPRKVARISEDTFSMTGCMNKRMPKSSGRSNGDEATAHADAQNAKKVWEGQGQTKLGFSAQRFAKILQVSCGEQVPGDDAMFSLILTHHLITHFSRVVNLVP
jgi:hypothetical protein